MIAPRPCPWQPMLTEHSVQIAHPAVRRQREVVRSIVTETAAGRGSNSGIHWSAAMNAACSSIRHAWAGAPQTRPGKASIGDTQQDTHLQYQGGSRAAVELHARSFVQVKQVAGVRRLDLLHPQEVDLLLICPPCMYSTSMSSLRLCPVASQAASKFWRPLRESDVCTTA